MELPNQPPDAVFRSSAGFVTDVRHGGALVGPNRLVDLVIYPQCVAAVVKRFVIAQPEDGLVLVQSSGPLRVRVGRFPPWQNTAVWVRQDHRLVVLLIGPLGLRRLREVLANNGFGIKEDRASLIHGLRRYEP